MTSLPQTILETDLGQIVITWIDCHDREEMDEYQPCTQVYGICFDDKGDILVIDEKGDGAWKIVGGKPQAGETPEQALARELMEEANVELQQMLPVGVQKVEEFFPDKGQLKVYYQWRFAGLVARLFPRTPDPDTGRIYPQKFVPVSEINEVVKWGETGKAMFAAAVDCLGRKA